MKKLMPINILDFISASIVLISLYFINTFNICWLFYALACGIYIIINWKKRLYGQAIMNIVASFIAIRNFIF